MAYSGDPASSDVDALRYNIGDTQVPFGLSDDELEFELVRVDRDVSRATLPAARALVKKLAGKTDARIGDISVSWSSRYKQALEVLAGIEGDSPTPTILMRGRRAPNEDPYFRLGGRP